MQPDLVREIAEAVVRDQLVQNCRFYAIISGLSVLASVAGHWLSSYLKKRGETFATKADMQEVLRQVTETTRATEEVKSTISQVDWATREWRTVRRLKLEELLGAAYSLNQWLDLQQTKWVYNEAVASDQAPMERMQLLSTLYFPELHGDVTAVWMAHQKAYLFILDIGKRTGVAKVNLDAMAYKATLDEFVEGWKPLYQSARLAVGALEGKASKLMAQFASAEPLG